MGEETKTLSKEQLLADLCARLDALASAEPETLGAYLTDLQSVREAIEQLSSDLKAQFHICPQVSQRLISSQSEREYLVLLERDEKRRSMVRDKLVSLSETLVGAERVLYPLSEFADRISFIDSIEDDEYRRSIRKEADKLPKIADELLEWKKSARRGLEKIAKSKLIGLLEIEKLVPDVPTVEPVEPVQQTEKYRPRPAAKSARSTEEEAAEKEADSATSKEAEAKIAEETMEAARWYLAGVVRTNPFASPRLASNVRFTVTPAISREVARRADALGRSQAATGLGGARRFSHRRGEVRREALGSTGATSGGVRQREREGVSYTGKRASDSRRANPIRSLRNPLFEFLD